MHLSHPKTALQPPPWYMENSLPWNWPKRLGTTTLGGYPGRLHPYEDLCQLPFLPGIFPGFLIKDEARMLCCEKQLIVCSSGKECIEVVKYFHLGRRGSRQSNRESLFIKLCTVPTSRRANSIWAILALACVWKTGREPVLALSHFNSRRGLHLGKWTLLALIFLWGKIFLLSCFLPFRFQKGGDRNGCIPQMEGIKDESIFKMSLYNTEYIHIQKLFHVGSPILVLPRPA